MVGHGIFGQNWWCDQGGLKVQPRKTTVVPFTKRWRLDGFRPMVMRGMQLEFSHQMK